MSRRKALRKCRPTKLRAELVSLLADGVLRYLAKRKKSIAAIASHNSHQNPPKVRLRFLPSQGSL